MLNTKPVIAELKVMLSSKAKTELVLNVLLFADFSVWSQDAVGVLITYFEEMIDLMHN